MQVATPSGPGLYCQWFFGLSKVLRLRVFLASLFCLTGGALQAQSHPALQDSVSAFQYPLDSYPEPLNMADFRRSIPLPREYRQNGHSGKVVVRALLDTLGRVEQCHIVSSTDTVLSRAVLSQIRELKFTPARKEGVAHNFWIGIPIQFNADSAAPSPKH